MTTTSQNLVLRELRLSDRVNTFSLGRKEHTPLKVFLKKDALNFHLDNIVKTYVLVNDNELPCVFAYISLMCSEVTLDETDKKTKDKIFKRYKTYSAIKLARLAIDKSLQGQGYGRTLVSYAIEIAKDHIMPNIGCRFLIVDAKIGAISFYEKVGFVILASDDNKNKTEPVMLLDLHKIN